MCSFEDGRKHSVLFEALNAGKLGFGIDLKNKDAASVIHRIISDFDVLIEGNRPGVMARLGIGYEVLSKINPKLIYCSVSGYGSTGPMAKRAGHDINYMATAGLLGLTGKSDEPPQVLGFQAADSTGSLQGTIGIMAALIDRSITGKGQIVDISLTESSMILAMPSLSMALAGVVSPPGQGMLDGGLPNYNIYKSSDGKSIAVGALEPHFWAKICTAVDRKDLLSPSTKFSDVKKLFESKTAREWRDVADSTDACIEVILGPDEIVSHPQHVARQVFLHSDVTDPGKTPSLNEKKKTVPRPPQLVVGPRLSSHPPSLLPPAAGIGEDTVKILKESGFSDGVIDELVKSNVIYCN